MRNSELLENKIIKEDVLNFQGIFFYIFDVLKMKIKYVIL